LNTLQGRPIQPNRDTGVKKLKGKTGISDERLGRYTVERPKCPFCGLEIERPKELDSRMPGEMPVGRCSCGAVYAADEAGHSLGIAQLDALLISCNMDADLAWGLIPEDDYIEKIVEKYDFVKHLIVPGGVLEGRRIRGALFFIRLHDDVQEVTSEGVKKRIKDSGNKRAERPYKRVSGGSLSKSDIEELVSKFDLGPILESAPADRKIIKNLQRLLYSGDDLYRKRAADALGQVASIIAEEDPGTISKLLQRLLTALADTAAFTWGAFEAVGEIISRRPELFSGYIPYLYEYLQQDTNRGPAVDSLSRIARKSPQLLKKVTFRFISFLKDPDPLVRGYSTRILGSLGAAEAEKEIRNLIEDQNMVPIYENGRIQEIKIGQIAFEALEKIGRKAKDV